MRATWVVALAVAISACGGTADTTTNEESPQSSSPPSTTTTPTPSPTPDPEEVQARREAEQCKREFTPFLDELQRLDSRLDVGLTQADYNAALGDIQVAYDRVPFNRLSESCILLVGVVAEDAFNEYLKANNQWADCIQSYACDLDDIEADLQKRWQSASRKIKSSGNLLRKLMAKDAP